MVIGGDVRMILNPFLYRISRSVEWHNLLIVVRHANGRLESYRYSKVSKVTDFEYMTMFVICAATSCSSPEIDITENPFSRKYFVKNLLSI